MASKLSIGLCMGSSCFARGNNRLLAALEDVIRKNKWQERVALSGYRCENQCSTGPNLKIDGVLVSNPTTAAITEMLAQRLAE